MTAPALHTGREPLRLQMPRGTPPAGWGALVGALAVTTILVALLGVGLLPGRRWILDTRPDAAPPPREHLTYVDVEPAPLPAAEPLRPPVTSAGRAASPPRPVASPAPAPATQRLAPPLGIPDRADTVVGNPGRIRSPDPRLAAPLGVPAPVGAGSARGAAPAPTCTDVPCPGALTSGVSSAPAPLDSAGRAERLQEIGASIPALASQRGKRLAKEAAENTPHAPEPAADPTRPHPAGVGVSMPVGLPGGGPSAAQRARDRKLHAENQRIMARIRARLDPAVADSLRADSLARARRGEPPLPPPSR